jgi:hypothetical protein
MGTLGDLRICSQCRNVIDWFILGGVKDCHAIATATNCQDYYWLCDNCIRRETEKKLFEDK